MLEYGVKNKREEFRNWHSILSRFFVQDELDWGGRWILILGKKMFVCHLKLAGDKFPTIREKFMKRFGKMAPCRYAIKAMAKKLKTKFSVWDKKKGICWNLTPASFNWQSNILTQSETSPALPALVILYKKSRKYKILVPKFKFITRYSNKHN